jgi:hypothetical protein
MNVSIPIVLLLAALLSTAAIADDLGGKGKAIRNADEKFQSLDGNDDSQISRS